MHRCVTRLIDWMSAAGLCALLAACAAPPPAPPPDVFRDALFAAPGVAVDASAVLAMSEPMKRYVHGVISRDARTQGRREALVQALYGHGTSLQLDYDTTRTRTAGEAFDARAGNCLSLVLMTAAFAWDLDLEVRFQAAVVDETWSRQGDLLVGAGHVNITLGGRRSDMKLGFEEAPLTIDFMPQELLPGMRIRTIDVATVVAMYMNNRAVETMTAGRLDDAYAFAREAIRQHPGYATAYNTLGVIYQRHGDLPEAGRAYRAALDRDPDDPRVLSNLAELFSRQGRADEAAALRLRLSRLAPSMPYLDFALGQDAMRRSDFAAARSHFRDEIARSTADHELHFWLALADFQLGAIDEAEAELRLARAASPSPRQQDLYAAKLAWLKSQHGATPGEP